MDKLNDDNRLCIVTKFAWMMMITQDISNKNQVYACIDGTQVKVDFSQYINQRYTVIKFEKYPHIYLTSQKDTTAFTLICNQQHGTLNIVHDNMTFKWDDDIHVKHFSMDFIHEEFKQLII